MKRTASKVPTTPIEITKLRSTVDESPCGPDDGPCVAEELEVDEEAVPDVLLLICDVEEIVDEVFEGSRTSKLNHIKSIFFRFPER